MSTFHVIVNFQGNILSLNVPVTWNVGRMKELILLYHQNSPSIRSQILVYNGEKLSNSMQINQIFRNDPKIEVELTIDPNSEVPDQMSGFKSALFKLREEEYIRKYDIAKQLLLDTHHKPQDTSEIPQSSILNSLPLIHSEISKRIKSIEEAEKPRRIRLRRVPFSIFFDVLTILRWGFFIFIARVHLGQNASLTYYMFIFLCYIINVRLKIEQYREKELKKLPREYLMKILPERFTGNRREDTRSGIFLAVYESGRGFIASLFPWFDPVMYANNRNHAYR